MCSSDLIGSNIFNVLLVLGIASVISPIAFIGENIIDILLLTVMSLIVWRFGWTRQRIDRKEGILMLLIYAAYLIYICIR